MSPPRVVPLLATCLLGTTGCEQFRKVLLGPSTVVAESPAPRPSAAPLAAPTATPVPTPRPSPTPTPCDTEGCPDLPDNTAPVVRVGAVVFFIECGGVPVPNSKNANEASVGCRVHFDCTPKDASNAPTRAKGEPYWTFSPASIISEGRPDVYSPAVLAVAPGTLEAYVVIDGISSNTVAIELVRN